MPGRGSRRPDPGGDHLDCGYHRRRRVRRAVRRSWQVNAEGVTLDFYRRLNAGRDAGKLGVWCLGLGVDPLTLVADILTVAVFDSDLFDAAFSGLVADNAEGRVVTSRGETGFSFTEQVVSRFTSGTEPMQAAGAAVLQLAWDHRALLLG